MATGRGWRGRVIGVGAVPPRPAPELTLPDLELVPGPIRSLGTGRHPRGLLEEPPPTSGETKGRAHEDLPVGRLPIGGAGADACPGAEGFQRGRVRE